MYPWDKEVNGTLDGYEVQPCTWNYWESACKPSNVKAYPAFFDGFDFVVVIIVYVALVILSIIIYFVKKRWTENSEIEYDNCHSNSTESYDSDINSKNKKLLGAINKSDPSNDSELKINQSIVKDL